MQFAYILIIFISCISFNFGSPFLIRVIKSVFFYNKAMAKKFFKNIVNTLVYNATDGKIDNIINFQCYKMNKNIQIYCNNTKISVFLIVIILAVALCYYFS